MRTRLLLFSLILGIPLIAFAVAEGVQAHYNSELRAELRQQCPNTDPAVVSIFSIDRLCQDPVCAFGETCAINTTLNLMSNAAVGAGVVGLALLLVIRLTGGLVKKERTPS